VTGAPADPAAAPTGAGPGDPVLAFGAAGLLGAANRTGLLRGADVHVATTLGRLTGEVDERVLLAVGLLVRAVRDGSVCIDLRRALTATGPDEDALAGVAGATGAAEGAPAGWAAGAGARSEAPQAGAAPPGWPDPDACLSAVRHSPLVSLPGASGPPRPVRLVDGLLYLDRYWQEEELVRAEVARRSAGPLRALDPARLRSALHRLCPGPPPDHQRLAAACCALGRFTIVAGGPGTGKTTTVARVLAVAAATWPRPPRVGLAAPTGKAAARLQEAVAAEAARMRAEGLADLEAIPAATLHRLLGSRPGTSTRFRHDRGNRLPHDLLVVDETSMVSLTMMSRLLEALRDDAGLVLVGDPDQLASVDAGAVLGDLVHRPPRLGPARERALRAVCPDDLRPAGEVVAELARDVVRLRQGHRFGASIGALADAVRCGDADRAVALLGAAAPQLEWVEEGRPEALDALRADVAAAGAELARAARDGAAGAALSALGRHRLLCAHRFGAFGVARWTRQAEEWISAAVPGYGADGEWYRGRPLLVTANDYDLRLFNGDTGVVVDTGAGTVAAAFGEPGTPVLVPVGRLAEVISVHAMTVHRSQGSQFDRVSVLLPPADSPLLTRELLYTAVTRARHGLRLIGPAEAVRAAIARPVLRASGLRRPGRPPPDRP
jgi:exodeoxyribonuclease V alpha subunit